jgi:Bacterial Ig-like domain
VVVSTYPEPFSIIEAVDGSVRFDFDERISERVAGGTINEAVSVSPRGGVVRVKHSRTALSVEMEGGFLPGVVYRVTLRPMVSDLFGNRMLDPFELVFSTGEAPVATTLAGEVWDRITGNAVNDALIYAISPDSLVHQSRTDRQGIFAFRYIPEGTFEVTAFNDVNRDTQVDSVEAQGTLQVTIATGDTVLVDVSVLEPDTAAAVVGSAVVLDSLTVVVDFDDFLEPTASIEEVEVGLSQSEGGEAPSVLRVFQEADYAAYVDAVVDSFARLDSIDDATAADARARDAAEAGEAGGETTDSTVAGEAGEAGEAEVQPPDTTVAGGAPVPSDTVVIDEARGRLPSGTGRAPEGVPGGDVAQGGAFSPGRATPTPLAPLQGSRPGPTQDGRRVLPARRIVVQLTGPLQYEVEYEIQVAGVVNINGLREGGGATVFVWELPPPDTVAMDSLGLDSLGLDTLAVDTLAIDTLARR